jgi:hypothetical protein
MKLFKIALLSSFMLIGCAPKKSYDNSSELQSTSSVRSAISQAAAKGTLNVQDIQAAFQEAGRNVSSGEGLAIFNAVMHPNGYTVSQQSMRDIMNFALMKDLTPEGRQAYLSRKTFGGQPIPKEVGRIVAMAKLAGAVAFDPSTTDSDGDNRFNPHFNSTSAATENMTFKYTEISPVALQADLEFKGKSQQMASQRAVPGNPNVREWVYTTRTGGTGHVLTHFDQAFHSDLFARTPRGAKWSSNFAILSDGSFHCLPAARRDVSKQFVLVNPDLARGRKLLFTGHLTAESGVITSIEMSGRITKLASRGDNVFVNPMALMQAWGYNVAPGLRLRFDTKGRPAPQFHNESFSIQVAANQP